MDPIVQEAEAKMEKSIASFKDHLGRLRSGRANPAMLSGIMCDYYGDKMDILSLSSVSMPEARQLLIKPYSREDIKAIAAAIAQANLGVNPQVEADCIRIIVPPLTEDLRKGIAKEAKSLSEEAKVSVRNIRRDYMDLLKEDDTMSDDFRDRLKADLEKVTSGQLGKIDEILAEKTKEILTI